MVKQTTGRIDIEDIQVIDWIKDLIPGRTEEEQELLQNNIKANKQQTPIIITDFDDLENILIDGHGRYEAFMALEIHQIKFVRHKFKDRSEIETFMFRQQLGRRNLTKQGKAYFIGSLLESKNHLAEEFSVSERYVANARTYAKAVTGLMEKGYTRQKLLEQTMSITVTQYKELTKGVQKVHPSTKKSVNWKLDEDLVIKVKGVAKDNGFSVSKQIENIIKEYLER